MGGDWGGEEGVELAFSPWFWVGIGTQAVGLGWDGARLWRWDRAALDGDVRLGEWLYPGLRSETGGTRGDIFLWKFWFELAITLVPVGQRFLDGAGEKSLPQRRAG